MSIHEQLNTATVVVLQVLFHYEIIYEMDPPILEKKVKESQSLVASPQPLRRGRGPYNMDVASSSKICSIIDSVFLSIVLLI